MMSRQNPPARVKDFLHLTGQAVDLVNKKDIALLQIREQGGQVAGLLDGGAGGDADLHTHLLRHNTGQRGFAQARRAVEQDVIHRLAALLRRPQVDLQVALGLLLTYIVIQRFRAQADLLRIGGTGIGADQTAGVNGAIPDSIQHSPSVTRATGCAAQW